MLDIDARDAARAFSLTQPPPGFVDDPYPVYALLREHDPLHELAPGSLLLTRHADVLAVYRCAQASSDKKAEFAPRLGVGSPILRRPLTSVW